MGHSKTTVRPTGVLQSEVTHFEQKFHKICEAEAEPQQYRSHLQLKTNQMTYVARAAESCKLPHFSGIISGILDKHLPYYPRHGAWSSQINQTSYELTRRNNIITRDQPLMPKYRFSYRPSTHLAEFSGRATG